MVKFFIKNTQKTYKIKANMKNLLFLLVILFPNLLYASFNYKMFDYSDWYRPFWADMHSSITSTELALAFNTNEYNFSGAIEKPNELYKVFSFSNIGLDLPLLSGSFGDGKFGLGLTLPLFAEIWVDYFEPITSPVINTSYRMGLPEVVFIHRFNPSNFIRNYAIKLTPFKHESTHLGDEFTLFRKESEMPITRINVSYNYAELGLTINDPDGTTQANHSLRFSLMSLINPRAGWYSIQPFEGDTSLVKYPTSRYEFYLQYQYQTATHKLLHLQGIFSLEWRNRVRYDYPFSYSDLSIFQTDEWRTIEDIYNWLNLNIAMGLRYNNPTVMRDYKVGLAAKLYNGINPYGQFRCIPFFQKIGIALLFER